MGSASVLKDLRSSKSPLRHLPPERGLGKTAIEIALYYTEDIVGIFTDPLLIFLAVGKFIIVVGWFMHLRYENKTVNRFFVGGMILALILFTIVMVERGSANYL